MLGYLCLWLIFNRKYRLIDLDTRKVVHIKKRLFSIFLYCYYLLNLLILLFYLFIKFIIYIDICIIFIIYLIYIPAAFRQ